MDDETLWEEYIKDIAPLKKAAKQPTDRPVERRPKPPRGQHPSRLPRKQESAPLAASSFEMDAQTLKKLKSGKIPIEATLDLHGMTQDRAHDAFSAFIRRAYAGNLRCLLVITGKGQGGRMRNGEVKRGVLREKLPLWAQDPTLNPLILKMLTAAPRHGGTGAWYIYLRRIRPPKIL